MQTFAPDTMYYWHNGELIDAYEHFGAHLRKENGKIVATRFTVYAPRAKHVHLLGSFNDFTPGVDMLRKIDDGGVFRIEKKANLKDKPYKYMIETHGGKTLYKSDPFAFYNALRPDTTSIVVDTEVYEWNDHDFMRRRSEEPPYERPMNIYEVHLGTWMQKPDGSFHTYSELVDHLIPYLLENHYTHVELMPVIEHPFDGSWGYQATGYYSVTSRYGSIGDFKYFVDQCHKNGVRVILDWVPSHIVKDAHGLHMFDGGPLYEYEDKARRENVGWGTVNLDLGKGETQSFLIASLLFFMRTYHVDGFRVDAVSNILYHHGSPEQGENEGGIAFLKKLSKAVFSEHPHALLIAEDSSAYPKVTHPLDHGGIGFNYKWNMGWMNDTLKYFSLDPIHRKYHHDLITFSLMYAFSENYVLPFSHDEVVHGKRSLVDKMPGDYWQKFANYRALVGFLHTHPGKPLMFMGGEFAQMHEWKDFTELDWHLLAYPMHESAHRFNRAMNKLSTEEPCLYTSDHTPSGFQWVDADNKDLSIFAFVRYDKEGKNHLLVVLNLTPEVHHDYKLGVPRSGRYTEIINSDYATYGGSDIYNGLPLKTEADPANGFEESIRMALSPLSISILKWEAVHEN
ncbi:MAG: 1,4-alpha-glucan branching protein GlgB [Candidatus Izemoplasmataceae bacterium]